MKLLWLRAFWLGEKVPPCSFVEARSNIVITNRGYYVQERTDCLRKSLFSDTVTEKKINNQRIRAEKCPFSPVFPADIGVSCALSCKALKVADFPSTSVYSYFARGFATSNLLAVAVAVAVAYVPVQVLCVTPCALPLSGVHLNVLRNSCTPVFLKGLPSESPLSFTY